MSQYAVQKALPIFIFFLCNAQLKEFKTNLLALLRSVGLSTEWRVRYYTDSFCFINECDSDFGLNYENAAANPPYFGINIVVSHI